MGAGTFFVIIFAAAILLLLAIKVIADFVVPFSKETRYIKMEMHRATSESEYKYWKRALKNHYLGLFGLRSKDKSKHKNKK